MSDMSDIENTDSQDNIDLNKSPTINIKFRQDSIDLNEPPTKRIKYNPDNMDSNESLTAKKKYSDYVSELDPESSKCPFNMGRASGGAEFALMGGLTSVQDLQELHLIDEVVEGEDESDDSDDLLYDSDDDEVPEEEIDALLEEGLPDEMKGPRSQRKKTGDETSKENPTNYELREKVLLVEKVSNHFEVLPDGWVEVTHNSGMPVYLHKVTRVCTFSRPYFLGPGSARKHTVPVSAVPCLKYLKDIEFVETEKLALKKELEEKEASEKIAKLTKNQEPSVYNNSSVLPPGPLANALVAQATEEDGITVADSLPDNFATTLANTRVESFKKTEENQSLNPTALRDYCCKRFKFKTIQLLRFPSWREKRKYQKREKRSRPQLPDGTKLISLVKNADDEVTPGKPKKEWVMNPKGKSYVCILHEYVQHVLKTQPRYEFKEVENASNPYSARIYISNIKYCTGYGSSKKNAKLDCARATLEILLPELGKKIRQDKKENVAEDLSFFDEIRVEDPNVPDWCNKASELTPYTVLLNCLQRNFGLTGNNVECKLIANMSKKSNEFVMTVGKHTVHVSCKNKKDGKQKASQAILQKLHPHIPCWGSLLRLYGNTSLESMREKKVEEQEITILQTNATQHQPNTSIINKLKQQMLKLREDKTELPAFKVFLPPENICLPSSHGTELNNVDL